MNAGTLETFFAEHQVLFQEAFGKAPGIYVLIKITKLNNIGIGMFPYNQLGN